MRVFSIAGKLALLLWLAALAGAGLTVLLQGALATRWALALAALSLVPLLLWLAHTVVQPLRRLLRAGRHSQRLSRRRLQLRRGLGRRRRARRSGAHA